MGAQHVKRVVPVLLVLALAAVLLRPAGERDPKASGVPVTPSEDPNGAGVGPAAADGRDIARSSHVGRRVGTSDGEQDAAFEVHLVRVVGGHGHPLTTPALRLLDPSEPKALLVGSDGERRVPAAPARVLTVVPISRGWSVAPERIQLGDDGPGRVELQAVPRHGFDVVARGRADGEPVTAVRVVASWQEAGTVERASSRPVVLENPEGRYRLDAPGISAGDVRVRLEAEGFAAWTSTWSELGPGHSLVIEAELLRMEEAFGSAAVTVLESGSGLPVPGVRAVAFAEVEGAPITGLHVHEDTLEPTRAGFFDPDDLAAPDDGTTDAGGRVRLRLEADTPYRIAAAAPHRPEVLSEIVTVTGGGTREVRLDLEAGSSISGRIVHDPQDRSLAHLAAVDSVSLNGTDTLREQRLDPEGRFRFDGIEPGTYRLIVHGRLASPGPTSHTTIDQRRIEVGPDEQLELEVLLGRLRAGRTIHGRLQFADDVPGSVVKVLVVAVDAATGRPAALAEQGLELGPTDAFEVHGLGAGPYALYAVRLGADGRRVELAAREVPGEDAGPPPHSIVLSPRRSRTTLRLADPAGPPQTVGWSIDGDAGLLAHLIEQLPRLELSGEQPTVILGLPPGRIRLEHDDEPRAVQVPGDHVLE